MIVIKNGRVMNPETGFDEVTDVVIEDNKIKTIGHAPKGNYRQIIDAAGMIVAPGLIDVHVHFRDPGYTYKEDLASGANAAAAGGYTTVICMANTNPVVDCVEGYEDVVKRGKDLPIHVLQAAAVTKEFGGEQLVDMEALAKAGVPEFTDDGLPIMSEDVLREAMKEGARLGIPISLHEEDPVLVKEPGVNEGKVSEEIGYGGAKKEAEIVMVERDCRLALETGATVDIQHISTGEGVDLVQAAKEQGAHVVAEATPHHFTLNQDDVLTYGTNAKMNPPLRTEEDRLRIIRGLKENTIEMIATDHAPHSAQEKNQPMAEAPSGIIGLETALGLGVTHLVKEGHLTMMELLEKMTINPARIYHLPQGRLTEGGIADLVIFAPDKSWMVKEFKSKACNSPFVGWKLEGKVIYTICEGEVVYLESSKTPISIDSEKQ